MSVYTSISKVDLEAFLTHYSVGLLVSYEGISEGIENTNYFVTTTQGEYVLTIYEQALAGNIVSNLEYIEVLGNSNPVVPIPVSVTNQSRRYHCYNNKYCTLTPRVKGTSPQPTFNKPQLDALGQAIGQLHQTMLTFYQQSPNKDKIRQHIKQGKQWREDTAAQLMPLLTDTQQQWLSNEMDVSRMIDTKNLPQGLIHADLFPDNTLYEENHLSGIIDWNNMTYDALLYDLAIIVNAWCSNTKGQFNTTLVQTFLLAYHSQRPLTSAEQNAWPAMTRLAGLRFWLSRTHDIKFPRKGELTQIKDPNEYKTIIQQRSLTDTLPWV